MLQDRPREWRGTRPPHPTSPFFETCVRPYPGRHLRRTLREVVGFVG
jgi:hypothetical protein